MVGGKATDACLFKNPNYNMASMNPSRGKDVQDFYRRSLT